MRIFEDLDQLIGSTPMLRLKKTEAAEHIGQGVLLGVAHKDAIDSVDIQPHFLQIHI